MALRNQAEGTGNSTIPILLPEPGGPAWVRRTRRVSRVLKTPRSRSRRAGRPGKVTVSSTE
ncbi:hypothetical protein HispidOSU_015322, partial [Sigmodon hispidus]